MSHAILSLLHLIFPPLYLIFIQSKISTSFYKNSQYFLLARLFWRKCRAILVVVFVVVVVVVRNVLKVSTPNFKLGVFAHHDKMHLHPKVHNCESYISWVMPLFKLKFLSRMMAADRRALVMHAVLLLFYIITSLRSHISVHHIDKLSITKPRPWPQHGSPWPYYVGLYTLLSSIRWNHLLVTGSKVIVTWTLNQTSCALSARPI